MKVRVSIAVGVSPPVRGNGRKLGTEASMLCASAEPKARRPIAAAA